MATRHFRAHQRFSVRLPVAVASVHRSVLSKGTTVDLGIGGGACELDTPLRLGAVLFLQRVLAARGGRAGHARLALAVVALMAVDVGGFHLDPDLPARTPFPGP